MPRSLKKPLCLLLTVCLLATALPAFAEDPLDQQFNSDSKMRVGRIILDSVKEDRAAGRSIDFGKIKDRIANKPLLTHFLIEQAGEQGGNVFQFALNGCCPPYGLIAGTVIGSVMGSLGGSIGYEASKAMERGEKLDARTAIGTGLKSIDMPTFIGKNVGSIIGATIGQALIPIPFLGMVVGGMAGGILGGIATNRLRRIGVVDRAAAGLQKRWEKVGQSILDGGKKPAAEGSAPGAPATGNAPPGEPLPLAALPGRLAASGIPPEAAAGGGAASPALRAAHDAYTAAHARFVKLSETLRPGDPALTEAGAKLSAAQRAYQELLRK